MAAASGGSTCPSTRCRLHFKSTRGPCPKVIEAQETHPAAASQPELTSQCALPWGGAAWSGLCQRGAAVHPVLGKYCQAVWGSPAPHQDVLTDALGGRRFSQGLLTAPQAGRAPAAQASVGHKAPATLARAYVCGCRLEA